MINTIAGWDVSMFYAFMENRFNTLASAAKQRKTKTKQTVSFALEMPGAFVESSVSWGSGSRHSAQILAVVCLLLTMW